MEWVPGMENELMLAALHSPYFLIIWDIKKQSKLWKKSFTDTLLSFNFDPFDGSKISCNKYSYPLLSLSTVFNLIPMHTFSLES